MKRLLSLVIALSLIASMVIPSFATVLDDNTDGLDSTEYTL